MKREKVIYNNKIPTITTMTILVEFNSLDVALIFVFDVTLWLDVEVRKRGILIQVIGASLTTGDVLDLSPTNLK